LTIDEHHIGTSFILKIYMISGF